MSGIAAPICFKYSNTVLHMSIAVDKFRHINFISDKNIRSVRLRIHSLKSESKFSSKRSQMSASVSKLGRATPFSQALTVR